MFPKKISVLGLAMKFDFSIFGQMSFLVKSFREIFGVVYNSGESNPVDWSFGLYRVDRKKKTDLKALGWIYCYELYARSKIRAKRTIRQSLPIQVFLEAGGPKGEWLALLQLAAKRVPRNQGNFF